MEKQTLPPHPMIALRIAVERMQALVHTHGWEERYKGQPGPLTLTRGSERILCLFGWNGRIVQARKWVGGDVVKIPAKEFRAILAKKASKS
jgi:hypothetical protein